MFDAALNVLAAPAWVLVSGRAPSGPDTADLSEVSTLRVPKPPKRCSEAPGVRLAMLLGIGTFFITQGSRRGCPTCSRNTRGSSARAAPNWAAAPLAVGVMASLVMPGLASPATVRDAARRDGRAGLAMVLLAAGPPGTEVAAALVLGLRSALSALVILLLMETEQVTVGNVGLAHRACGSRRSRSAGLGPQVVGAFGDSDLGFLEPSSRWRSRWSS